MFLWHVKQGNFMANFQDSYPPHKCTKMPLTASPWCEEKQTENEKSVKPAPSLYKVHRACITDYSVENM